MPRSPRQIGWGQQENLLWNIEGQMEHIAAILGKLSGSTVGPPGPQGIPGTPGATGTPGAVWYSGATVPTPSVPAAAIDGDYYLKTDTADVYYRSSGTWGIVANIKGVQGVPGVPVATGNTITVDQIYGDDALALINPHSQPFLTIQAALNASSAQDLVFIRPGIYNEVLTVPANISLRGASAESVIIQQTSLGVSTTLLTVGNGSRVEDVTLNMTTSLPVTLIGVALPSPGVGNYITVKLRSVVINLTSTSTVTSNMVGILSSGTSDLVYSSSDVTKGVTINVTSSTIGAKRGILVSGPNYIGIRDTSILVSGNVSDSIGVETNDASAVAYLKSSIISGGQYDIARTLGNLYVGTTDLVHNTAGPKSFTPTQAPAGYALGIISNVGANRRFYLVPGSVTEAQLTSEPVTNTYNPALAFPIPNGQNAVIITSSLVYTGTLPAGASITGKVYRNAETTPLLSLVLASGGGNIANISNQSFNINATDFIRCTVEVVGNPPATGALGITVRYY